MSEDVQTIPVEADFDPSEVEEILEAPKKTDDELVLDALKAFAEMEEEGPQAGGAKRPKQKKDESDEDFAVRLAAWEEEEARDGAEGIAVPAPTLAPAPTPSPPAAKKAAITGPTGAPAPAPSRFPEAGEEYARLAAKIDGLRGDAAKAADRAAAWLFRNLPGFVKASVGGAVLKAGIDNPYSVRWIGKTLLNVAGFFVERFQTTADWSMYKTAIEMLAADVGEFAGTVRDAATAGPAFAITVTLLIMRYRANNGGAGSVTGQIAADAKALADAGARIVSTAVGAGAGAAPTAAEAVEQAASYMWSGMVNAGSAVATKARSASANARLYAQEQLKLARGEATVAALREAAEKTRQGPTGQGAAELRREVASKGAPAAEAGDVEGAIKLVPAKPEGAAPATALTAIEWGLTKNKTPKNEVTEVAALGAGAGAPPPIGIPAEEEAVGFKRRRRLSEATGTPMGRRVPASAAPAVPMQVDKPEEETTGEGASESGDVTMSGTDEKKEKKDGGRRRKTPKNKRKTYRKKGKKTRGKTRGRRAFIY